MRRLLTLTSPAGAFNYDYGWNATSDAYWFNWQTGSWEYESESYPGSLVLGLTLPTGAYITNAFDVNARLLSTALANSGGTNLDAESYAYNQASQRIGETNTAGDYRNYTYDNMGELTTAIGKEAGGVTNRWQEQLGYAYDAAGNLIFRTNNALLQEFNVNSLNELTTITNGGRLTVAGTTTSAATNVTVNTSNAVLYADVTFASTNQPWSSGNNTFKAIAHDVYGRWSTNTETVNLPATNSYTYDLNGNLLYDGNRAFAYDDENELIQVTVTNNWQEQFTYDGKMRRRIEKDYSWNGSSWLQTNEIHFIYDGNMVVQERNVNNLPTVTYTRGNDLSGKLQSAGGIGGLLARTDNSQLMIGSSSAHAFYHADGNGNVTCLIYTNQTIAAKYLYDPYGNTLSAYGALANANSYRFSSKEWNANSGLYYYLYRFYDPNLQRWPNRDPLGDAGSLLYASLNRHHYFNRLFDIIQQKDGINLYEMIQNSPANLVDRFGLSVEGFCAHLEEQIEAAEANLFSGPFGTYNPQVGAQLGMLQGLYDTYNCDDDNDGGNTPPIVFNPCPSVPGPFKPGPQPKPKPVPVMPIVPMPKPAPIRFPIPEPIPIEL
jgi:RHS repeat-associated protein